MIVWILLIIVAYLIYAYIIKPMKYWEELKVPFVKPQLIIGNSGDFIFQKKSWAAWVEDLYNSHQNTRYIGVYQFNLPSLLIKDLELLKQITIKDFDHFTGRRKLVTEDVEPIFSKNLLSIEGHRWKQMRATLSPTFTGNKMRTMFILMKECTQQFTNHIQKKVDSSQTYEVELRDLFGKVAVDIIASTAFGIPCDSMLDENNDFLVFSRKATSFGGLSVLLKVMGYIYFKPIMKLFNFKIFTDDVTNFFKNIVVSNMKDREEKGIVRPDMIHLLMEARKGRLKHERVRTEDDETGFATVDESDIVKNDQIVKLELSDDDILAQAFIFFLAGFDGVSTLMSHMTYEIAINQDVQERLQEEVDTTLDECKGNITYEKLMKMKYMDMVFCETLRKWSNPLMDRICTKPYTIPAEKPGEVPITLNYGDIIILPIYAMHRDPKYFPNPDKFDPERFNEENKKNIKPFSYIPFGIGPKNCIGSRYAIMEIKLILFYLLSKFNFVLTAKSDVPIQLTKKAFSMSAENGFWVGIQSRTK